MSSKMLMFLISSTVLCIALPQKKLMVDGCNRPKMFSSQDVLADYINCVKSLASDQRYGKRSHPPSPSLLIKNLRPSLYNDYGLHPSNDLQELYDILKYDDN